MWGLLPREAGNVAKQQWPGMAPQAVDLPSLVIANFGVSMVVSFSKDRLIGGRQNRDNASEVVLICPE